jgi:hypothetical protein
MKKNSLLILLCFLFSGLKIHGQISTNELPVSFSFTRDLNLSDNKAIKYLPVLDMEKIQKEDEERDVNGAPPRFGYKH